MTSVRDAQRRSRAEHSKPQAVLREHERAEEDYRRLRSAYLDMAQREHGNEVALAMVGADMDRAHAVLQHLSGLRPLPPMQELGTSDRHQNGRLAEQHS